MTRKAPHERIGLLAILAGASLAFAVQIAAPVGVPLYDGALIVEPYRYLQPAGGQVGDPTSFTASPAIVDGVAPDVIAATMESPPQAQLIAQRGAFEVSAGVTSLIITITPIEPPAVAPDGRIAGNVYRITVTDQSGGAVGLTSCSGTDCPTLVLRAPEGVTDGTINRFSNGTWSDVRTLHAGVVGLYQASVSELGDFAVVQGGAGGIDLTLLVLGVGIAIVLLAFVGLILVRQRPVPAYPTPSPIPLKRLPSKRKRGRRPPSGRSDP